MNKPIEELETLTKEELVALIVELAKIPRTRINEISISDFIVRSETSSLREVKKVMNDLIKDHSEFFTNRNNKKKLESFYIG